MKRIYLLFLFLVALTPISIKAVETATQVLDRCAAEVNNTPSLELDFTLKVGEQTSKCSMIVARERFHLKSAEMLVWFDGTTQWVYMTASHELSITEPMEEELLEANPFAILNHYNQAYTCRRLSGSEQQIELVAKNQRQTVRKAVVTIDSATFLPSELVVTMRNGTVFSAQVTAANKSGEKPISAFVFDKTKYHVDEINDLR